ncbi:MAG: TraR/DksA C4-type zinc finger protein [Chloroflexota bacterium]
MEQSTIRKRLEEERNKLQAELADLEQSTPSPEEKREGSPFGKREEEATETFELERRLALEKKLSEFLRDADIALQKLDKGTYGLCDLCHEPIGAERLEALPTASLCLKCKSAHDRGVRGRR